MKIVMLLVLLTAVSECSSSRVVGQVGHNVTLSCKYDIKSNGVRSVCWERGELPVRGCNNQLISTDGQKVVSRASSRYQLLGRLDEGDVSLTILNVSESDAGRYGCRVDIYGLFNDEKHHFDLTVLRGVLMKPSLTRTSKTTTEPTAANHTTGQLTSSESLFTSSSDSIEAEKKSSSLAVVLVYVRIGLIVMVTAGGFVFIVRRWRQRNKILHPQHQIMTQQNLLESAGFASGVGSISGIEALQAVDALGVTTASPSHQLGFVQ